MKNQDYIKTAPMPEQLPPMRPVRPKSSVVNIVLLTVIAADIVIRLIEIWRAR